MADAITFIHDVLAGKIVLQVHCTGERPTGGAVRYVDEKPRSWVFPVADEDEPGVDNAGEERIEEFVWSGPYRKKDNAS